MSKKKEWLGSKQDNTWDINICFSNHSMRTVIKTFRKLCTPLISIKWTGTHHADLNSSSLLKKTDWQA